MVVRPAISISMFFWIQLQYGYNCHNLIPVFRSSSCSRLHSQTVGTGPCSDWRSWLTSAMPPSDTSAACVIGFCVTLSRTTARTRYSLSGLYVLITSVRAIGGKVHSKIESNSKWKRPLLWSSSDMIIRTKNPLCMLQGSPAEDLLSNFLWTRTHRAAERCELIL